MQSLLPVGLPGSRQRHAEECFVSHSRHAARTLSALALLFLAACTKQPEGTYHADFSSSDDPNVAVAAALMNLSLTFAGEQVSMQVTALGQSKTEPVLATYDGDQVLLKVASAPDGNEMVFDLEDENTLQCAQCPPGLPSVWRKRDE